MEPIIQNLITIICTLLASSGMWSYLQARQLKKREDDEAIKAMLKGLGHARIMELGQKYIERGDITDDEYENLYEYIYKPYKALGGNGSAERKMEEVRKLKTRHH